MRQRGGSNDSHAQLVVPAEMNGAGRISQVRILGIHKTSGES